MNKELNGNMEMFYDRCSKKNSELLHSLRKSFTFLQIFLRITQVNRTAHYVSFASAR